MRFSAIVREASRNISSGTTRFTLFGFMLSLLMCGLIFADSVSIGQEIRAATTFRDSGGATLILEAPGQIDGQACQALEQIPGVESAGALRETSTKVFLSALPEAPVPEYEVTSGIPSLFLASGPPTEGLVVSQEVADALGISIGEKFATSSGEALVSRIYPYPSDGRRPGFGYAVLSVTDIRDPFDECWVKDWPQIDNLRALLFTTLKPGLIDDDNRPRISQLNSTLGGDFSGHEDFLSRITRSAAPLMFVLALLLGFVAVRLRRLQLASALHAGVSRQDVFVLQLFEALAWAIPSTVIGVGGVAVMAAHAPAGDQVALFYIGIAIPLAAFVGTLLGTVLSTAVTKERHLFRYFKDR